VDVHAIGRRRKLRPRAGSEAHDVVATIGQEEDMLPPIVIGAHPKRHDREPIELGLVVSGLTGAPMDVVGTFSFDTTPHRTATDEYGRILREQVQQAVGDTDRPSGETRVHVMLGSPAHALHENASKVGAGLIIVGSSHRGAVGRITLSTTADRVLQRAPCPVAVAPRGVRGEDAARQGVAVAFVDTPGGWSALRAGAAIARCAGTSLTAYTVIESHTDRSDRHRAEAAVERAIADIAHDLDAETRVIGDGGVEALVAESRRHSFLVRGCRARRPVRPPLAFGLPSKLARQAACPLVVVPPGREEPLEALFGAHVTAGRGAAPS
jgi:nucleotide-binding universal stress UspA family protein